MSSREDAPDAVDPAEQRRLRARLAQQRFKANRKAAEESLVSRIAHAQFKLGEFNRRAERQRELSASFRARASAASAALDNVRDELLRAIAAAGAAPTPRRSPSVRQSLPEILAQLAAGTTASEHYDGSGPRPSPIFRDSHALVRSFKYEVFVSIGSVQGDESLAALLDFRRAMASRLGCTADEICWKFQSERYAEVPFSNSHIGTPECLLRQLMIWTAALIERRALVSIMKRLEHTREQLQLAVAAVFAPPHLLTWADSDGAAAPLAASGAPAPSLADMAVWLNEQSSAALRGPLGSGPQAPTGPTPCVPPPLAQPAAVALARQLVEREAHAASTLPTPAGAAGVASAAKVVARDIAAHFGSITLSAAPDDAAVDPGPSQAALEDRRAVSLIDIAKSLLVRVFSTCIPRMHPVDAVALCKGLLQKVVQPRADGGALRGASLHAEVTAAMRAVVNAALLAVQAHPLVPELPSTIEGVEGELDKANKELEAINCELSLMRNLTTLDGARTLFEMRLRVGPLVMGHAEYERQNLEVFKAMELDRGQKRALVSAWGLFQKLEQQRMAGHEKAVEQLAAVPGATAADVADLQLTLTCGVDGRDARAAPPPTRDEQWPPELASLAASITTALSTPSMGLDGAQGDVGRRLSNALQGGNGGDVQSQLDAVLSLADAEFRKWAAHNAVSSPGHAAPAASMSPSAQAASSILALLSGADAHGRLANGRARPGSPWRGRPASSSSLPSIPPTGASSPRAARRSDGWMRDVLGASPESTDAAAAVLSRLLQGQDHRLLLLLHLREELTRLLSQKQNALMLTQTMPMPDVFRLAVLACSGVMCDHVMSRTSGARGSPWA